MSEGPITMICARCGSEEITCDAQLVWEVEAQEWGILNVLDHGDCVECEEAALIIRRPVEPGLDNEHEAAAS